MRLFGCGRAMANAEVIASLARLARALRYLADVRGEKPVTGEDLQFLWDELVDAERYDEGH